MKKQNESQREIISKPWGEEIILCKNKRYAGKILRVNKGEMLSKQYHENKDETLYLIKGIAKVLINDKERITSNIGNILKGQIIDIPHRTIHRIEAIEDCIFIEFSTHELDDVIRLEDKYGRIN